MHKPVTANRPHTRNRGCIKPGTVHEDCATAAARTKNTFIAGRHRRLQRRRGPKIAKVAISRTILKSAWWLIRQDLDYKDLGPEHFLTRTPNPTRRAHRLVLEPRSLGHDIRLTDLTPRRESA